MTLRTPVKKFWLLACLYMTAHGYVQVNGWYTRL